MKKPLSPFLISGYISKEYFCDRESELEILKKNTLNGVNTTLISPRRLGKTGLIFHLFDSLKNEKDIKTIYVDIYSSLNIEDFIRLLAEAILEKFPEKTSFGKKFLTLIKGFRPRFTFDSISGAPQIEFNYQSQNDKEFTLKQLLLFLDKQETKIIIAIDEFQQIVNYPEKNIEAILRTYIQQLKNINFIFSGSQAHILAEIFLSSKRPFFSSTLFINLDKIERSKYKEFIQYHFSQGDKLISEECIDYILDWTKGYTFYTQSLCNKVYTNKKIDLEIIKLESIGLIKEKEPSFFQYRNLLTPNQWKFLIALAKEEEIEQIYSNDFLKKYNLGTPSSAKRIVSSLLEREMILERNTKEGSSFTVYDVFLMRWLQLTY